MARSRFAEVAAAHRRRLSRMAEHRGVASLKGLYDEAEREVVEKLRTWSGAALRERYTAHAHRMVLAQLMRGQADLVGRMVGELGEVSRDAQVDSLRGLIEDIHELEGFYTGAEFALPIEEAARFRDVIDGRRDSLLRQHETSMTAYGEHLVGRMEDGLSLSLVEGETLNDAIDRIQGVASNEWWQAERIARTETAWAFNATHADGMAEAAEELPDLMMRWSEYVDDDTGQPLDERVAVDSLAMHGQVVPPGGRFVIPPSSDVPDAKGRTEVPESLLARGEVAFPPNRPNDRATVTPWRPGWGVSAWVWRDGRRVDL